MTYALPSDTDWVTASWQDHKDRDPPSSEPGTDYGSDYGSPLYAVGAGVIVDLSHSPSGGTGRYVTIDLDDGRRTRSLHLAEIWVYVGQRVEQGQQIGLTGASGFGSDWGYGSHVHQTLFPGHAYDFAHTLDFAPHVAPPPKTPTEIDRRRDMPAFVQLQRSGDTYMIAPGLIHCHATDEEKKNNLVEYGLTPADVVIRNDDYMRHTLSCHGFAELVEPGGKINLPAPGVTYIQPPGTTFVGVGQPPSADPATTNPLTGPAWVAGFFLGLIGLVEVVRLVVDLIV